MAAIVYIDRLGIVSDIGRCTREVSTVGIVEIVEIGVSIVHYLLQV